MAILRIVSSIVVLSALTVFPDIIDDFEDGDNRNETGYYSYYYDDSPDGGTSIITNALKDSKGKMVMLPTANAGRDGGYAAEISWKFGENKPVGCSGKCDYGQLVGMGTMLAAEGATATWAKNATTIRFCVKAVTTCKLTVEIGTLAVTDFGYHFKTVPVTTEWTLVSITLADLPQPLWAIESMLDPADMTKIQFKISADNSGTPSSGTLYIDDIEIDEVIPPFQNGICDYCIVEREYFIWNYHGSCKELLADFEGEANLTQSKLRGRYWYVYNDSTRPDVIPSRFTYGTQKNEDDGSDMLIVNPGNFDGYNNTQGLKVSFKLGESFIQGTDLIRSFAGVGCMLSYSDTSGIEPVKKYINGSFCSGIYFDYKTDSVHERFKFLTFEFYDGTTRPDGMVFSTKLPVTQGQWKGAKIPFDSLKLPDWPEKVALLNDTQKKFDVKKLDKIQIRFQGINEIGATFSLDNVYWYLDAPCPGVTYKATQENKMAVTSKLTVKNLTVSLNSLPQGVHTGFAEIIGTDGRIFAEKKITASGTSSFSIRTGHLSPGVYMLRVNTVNGNGLKTSFNDKVTIVQR